MKLSRYTLNTYLNHFLNSSWTENMEHGTLVRIHSISRCLAPVVVSAESSRRRYQVLDMDDLLNQLVDHRQGYWRACEENQLKILGRYDCVYRKSAECAVRFTHEAVDFQHRIRQR